MDETLPAQAGAPIGKVTLQGLARELGLSTATISLALRDSPMVAEATRLKVQEAARARGYVANRGAAALRTARTNIVALGLHDIVNPSFTELLAAVEDALSEAGKTVLLDRELPRQEFLGRQRVALASLFEREQAAAHSRDYLRFAADNPALGRGRRQIRNRQRRTVRPDYIFDPRAMRLSHRCTHTLNRQTHMNVA